MIYLKPRALLLRRFGGCSELCVTVLLGVCDSFATEDSSMTVLLEGCGSVTDFLAMLDAVTYTTYHLKSFI